MAGNLTNFKGDLRVMMKTLIAGLIKCRALVIILATLPITATPLVPSQENSAAIVHEDARRFECNFDLGEGVKGNLFGKYIINFTEEFNTSMVSYCYENENCRKVYLKDILCAFKNLYGVEIYGVNGMGEDGERYIYNNRTPGENTGYVEVLSGMLSALHILHYDLIDGAIDLVSEIIILPEPRQDFIRCYKLDSVFMSSIAVRYSREARPWKPIFDWIDENMDNGPGICFMDKER
jgi:hypothetical protein